jgi:uncharacterized protein YdbL (DUF1318 family)
MTQSRELLLELGKVNYKRELKRALAAKRRELEDLLIVRRILDHPDKTYGEIAESLGISLASLMAVAGKHGVERLRGRGSKAYAAK